MPITLAKKMVKALAPLLGVLVLLIFLFPLDTLAVFTKQINYQGKLTNSSGVAVTNGSYSIQFLIYDASSGGNLVWSETQTVTVTNGLFSTMLGSVSSLASVDFNQALYITINVGSDGEMTPRKTLGAVPNAFNSEKFDGLATTSFAILSGTNIFSGLNTFSATTTLATTTLFSSNSLTFMQTTLGNIASSTGGFGVKDSLNIIGYDGEYPTLALTDTDAEYIYYNDFDYSSTAGTSTVNFFVEDPVTLSISTTTFRFKGDLDIVTGDDLFLSDLKLTEVGGDELTFSFPEPTGHAEVYVSGNYAYLVLSSYASGFPTDASSTLSIIDVSNPSKPRTISTINVLPDARSVTVSGRYAYIGGYNFSGGNYDGLDIIDISNPYAPIIIGGNNLFLPSHGQGVRIMGKYAYTSFYQDAANTDVFRIIDISDSQNPRVVSGQNLTLPRGGRPVFVSGNYAYLPFGQETSGTDGFRILDISNPANPQIVGGSNLSLPADCRAITVSGSHAYLSCHGTDGHSEEGRTLVIDVSNPTTPQIVSSSTQVLGMELFLAGDYLYSGSGVFNVSSSTNIEYITNYSVSSTLGTVWGMFVSGGYLYVGLQGNAATVVQDAFRVFQITLAEAPSIKVGSFDAGQAQIQSDLVVGGRLFANDNLNVGFGGILSDGGISVTGSTTSSYFGGSVGIGTTTPYYKLTINASNTTDNLLQVSTTTNQNIFLIDNQGLVSLSSLATNGAVYSNNGVLTNVNPSSLEYKNTINPAELNIDALLGLQVKSFNWNENGQADFGLIAEEVRDALPELYIDDGHVKGYRADHLPFYLLQIAQRQAKQIAELDSRIASGTINFASSSDGVVSLSALQSLAGNWSISADGILTAKKIIAEEAIIENGVTVRDKATGAYTCIFVENGTIQTKLGECSSEETESGGGGAILAPTQGGGETSSTTPTVDESPASTTEDSNSSPSASQPGPAETDQGSNPDPPTETEAPVAAEPVAEPAPAPTETPPATES